MPAARVTPLPDSRGRNTESAGAAPAIRMTKTKSIIASLPADRRSMKLIKRGVRGTRGTRAGHGRQELHLSDHGFRQCIIRKPSAPPHLARGGKPLSAGYVRPVGSVLMRTSPPRAWASRIKSVERPPRLCPTLASQSPQRPACLQPRLVPTYTRRGVRISVDCRPSVREPDAAGRCCGSV
jgi:hypothetical protein